MFSNRHSSKLLKESITQLKKLTRKQCVKTTTILLLSLSIAVPSGMNIVPEGRHIFLSINGETNVFIDQERSGKSVVHTLREEDLRAGLHLTYQSNNLREESGKLFVWGITDNGDFQTFNGSWDVGEPIQWSDIEP